MIFSVVVLILLFRSSFGILICNSLFMSLISLLGSEKGFKCYSSRYRTMSFFFLHLFLKDDKVKLTTSWHNLAPAFLVISNNVLSFFIHACLLLKSKDFLEWLIMRLPSSEISVYDSTNFNAFLNNFSFIDE